MNIALALLLTTPLFNCFTAFPFVEMLDTVSLVAFARIDSIWTTYDTVFPTPCSGKSYLYINRVSHYFGDILALYAKSDSLSMPQGSIHIAYRGVQIAHDGSVAESTATPSFELNETFMAPIYESSWFRSETETIYQVNMCWRYRISNDSTYVLDSTYNLWHLSLREVHDSLSAHLIKME